MFPDNQPHTDHRHCLHGIQTETWELKGTDSGQNVMVTRVGKEIIRDTRETLRNAIWRTRAISRRDWNWHEVGAEGLGPASGSWRLILRDEVHYGGRADCNRVRGWVGAGGKSPDSWLFCLESCQRRPRQSGDGSLRSGNKLIFFLA